jgi:hypothetical protein
MFFTKATAGSAHWLLLCVLLLTGSGIVVLIHHSSPKWNTEDPILRSQNEPLPGAYESIEKAQDSSEKEKTEADSNQATEKKILSFIYETPKHYRDDPIVLRSPFTDRKKSFFPESQVHVIGGGGMRLPQTVEEITNFLRVWGDGQSQENQSKMIQALVKFIREHSELASSLDSGIGLEAKRESTPKTEEESDDEVPATQLHEGDIDTHEEGILMPPPPLLPPPPPDSNSEITIHQVMEILWGYYKNHPEVWGDGRYAYLARAIYLYAQLKQTWNNEQELMRQMKTQLTDPLTTWIMQMGPETRNALTFKQKNVLLSFIGQQPGMPQHSTGRGRGSGDSRIVPNAAALRNLLEQRKVIQMERSQKARDIITRVLSLSPERTDGLVAALQETTRLTGKEQTTENLKENLRRHINTTPGEEEQIDPCLEEVMKALFTGWMKPQDTSRPAIPSMPRLRRINQDNNNRPTAPAGEGEKTLNAQQKAKLEDLIQIGEAISSHITRSGLTIERQTRAKEAFQTLRSTKREYQGQTIVDINCLGTVIHYLQRIKDIETLGRNGIFLEGIGMRDQVDEILNLGIDFWRQH